MFCTECSTPCELHNITECATCHTHEGDCDFGDCNKPAVTKFEFSNAAGTVTEIRPFCKKHAYGVGYGLTGGKEIK